MLSKFSTRCRYYPPVLFPIEANKLELSKANNPFLQDNNNNLFKHDGSKIELLSFDDLSSC